MSNRFLQIISRVRNSIIVKNSVYTFLLQGANYVLPLLIIPYLTRTMGKDGYGKIAFTQSFVMLAGILTEYGFSLSATREIAQNRNDKQKLNEIVSLTIYSKLFLVLITFLLITPLFLVIPIFKENFDLFLVSYFMLFAIALNTDWFFLGIEFVKLSSFAIIFGKLLLVILTFLLVTSNSEPVIYLIIFASTTLIANSINLFMVKNRINFIFPELTEIIKNLKNSISLFVFKFTVSLYTSANAFVVGLILSPAQVGIYAGAEKITKAIVGFWTPLSNVIYPRINNLLKVNFPKAKKLMRLVAVVYAVVSIALTLLLFIGAEFLTHLILGEAFAQSTDIIRLLSPIVFLIAMSNVTGILWLLPLKRDRQFNYIIITAGIINIVLGVPFTIFWGPIGMALSVLLTEFFVTASCFYLISKIKENSVV